MRYSWAICRLSCWARFLDISQSRIFCGLPWSVFYLLLGALGARLTRFFSKVNRAFLEVVSYQPHLQYKCELAAAGLLDNPNVHCTLFDRRTALHQYRSRFDALKPTGNSSLPLKNAKPICLHKSAGDVYTIYAAWARTFHFYRPLSVSGSHATETWSFQLTFDAGQFAIHPSLDLIVIADNT